MATKSERAIRGMIRHRAKKFLLEGKSDMVSFVYNEDEGVLYAVYEHEGEKKTYEVGLELRLYKEEEAGNGD